MGSFDRFDKKGDIAESLASTGRPCRDRTDDPLIKSYKKASFNSFYIFLIVYNFLSFPCVISYN